MKVIMKSDRFKKGLARDLGLNLISVLLIQLLNEIAIKSNAKFKHYDNIGSLKKIGFFVMRIKKKMQTGY